MSFDLPSFPRDANGAFKVSEATKLRAAEWCEGMAYAITQIKKGYQVGDNSKPCKPKKSALDSFKSAKKKKED